MNRKPLRQTLRVASYNIRKAVGLDWRRDPKRIAAVLAELDADVIAIQEADRRFGRRRAALARSVIAADTNLTPVEIGLNGVSLGWHGNAVLVGPRVTPGAVTYLPLTSPDPRGAVLVDIETPFPFTLVAVHLSLFRRARRRQLVEVRRALDSRAGRPAVVVGDFNEWRPGARIEPLAADFSILSPGNSFHAARPVAALDKVAFSDQFSVLDAGVRRCHLSRRASDHLPVWAELAFDGEVKRGTRPGPRRAVSGHGMGEATGVTGSPEI